MAENLVKILAINSSPKTKGHTTKLLGRFVNSAKKENIFVDLITNYTEGSEFLSEDSLLRKMSDNLDSLESVDTIVIWTKGSSGLTVLSQLQKSLNMPAIKNC